MNWSMVKLGEVLTFIRGITFKPEEKIDASHPDAVICMRTKNIQDELDESDLIAVPKALVKREELFLKHGDILISSANSWNLVGKVVQVPKLDYQSTAGGFISILRPVLDKVLPDYLYLFINSEQVQHDIRLLGKQTTNISNLDRKRFLELEIPLPPVSIQKRIAEILMQCGDLRKQSIQISSELNALAQAVYESNVGISAKEHSNWSSYTISDLCDTSKSSMRTGPFGSDLKHSEFVSSGVAVIGIDNAVSNEFRWVERRFITKQKYEKLKRYTVHPHDVIITIMGTTGRVAVIPADIPLAISTKHLAVLTLDKNKANPHFIADTLKWNSHVIEQIKRSNKGAIMDGLNLGTIKSLAVVLPPKEIQDEYVLKAKAIQDRIAETKELSLTLELQFNALMQRAFSGKLDLKKVA
ncbi:restriction endonuclease subunit S [Serratia proteamaculans]|uniref:restriction endonuclease subunit S n=1 Tax=Serratia proteamaculans TaxID=28151 RepID=UPI00107658BD|nr:restriction endonuclease subunit S [Serratia proteamaculans]TFZ51617.1 restriction endonuclease subunit S [Serratia proteamaculans]